MLNAWGDDRGLGIRAYAGMHPVKAIAPKKCLELHQRWAISLFWRF